MLELTHLEREVVNAVEVHDVVLVHQGDGDGHHNVLQREKNWLKDCEISGDQVRFGRFVKCSDHRERKRRRNCIIQEFVAEEESDRGKRSSGVVSPRLRCETRVIFIWSLRNKGSA